METWSYIEEFPGYVVSTGGETAREGNEDRPMKIALNNRGMPQVILFREGRPYNRSVANLVADAFLPFGHPAFNSLINLDGSRRNCRADNLMRRPRWFTIRYHQQFTFPDFHQATPRLFIPETDERFNSFKEPATRFGLLYKDIVIAAINKTPIFPTGQEFRFGTW
jgi:hypothetical protein